MNGSLTVTVPRRGAGGHVPHFSRTPLFSFVQILGENVRVGTKDHYQQCRINVATETPGVHLL